jgi:hypothetical protein
MILFAFGSKLQVLPKTAVSCRDFRQAQEKVAQRTDAILRKTLEKKKNQKKCEGQFFQQILAFINITVMAFYGLHLSTNKRAKVINM